MCQTGLSPNDESFSVLPSGRGGGGGRRRGGGGGGGDSGVEGEEDGVKIYFSFSKNVHRQSFVIQERRR